MTSKEAHDALWTALQCGELPARGIPTGRADRVKIPPVDWLELTYFEPSKGGNDAIGNNDREVKFLRVLVRSKDILRIWSATRDRETLRRDFGAATNTPKLQAEVLKIAKTLWPDGVYPGRVIDRDKAIEAEFKNRKETPPSSKTIRRAMAKGQ